MTSRGGAVATVEVQKQTGECAVSCRLACLFSAAVSPCHTPLSHLMSVGVFLPPPSSLLPSGSVLLTVVSTSTGEELFSDRVAGAALDSGKAVAGGKAAKVAKAVHLGTYRKKDKGDGFRWGLG